MGFAPREAWRCTFRDFLLISKYKNGELKKDTKSKRITKDVIRDLERSLIDRGII